jgi:hypothetical protein
MAPGFTCFGSKGGPTMTLTSIFKLWLQVEAHSQWPESWMKPQGIAEHIKNQSCETSVHWASSLHVQFNVRITNKVGITPQALGRTCCAGGTLSPPAVVLCPANDGLELRSLSAILPRRGSPTSTSAAPIVLNDFYTYYDPITAIAFLKDDKHSCTAFIAESRGRRPSSSSSSSQSSGRLTFSLHERGLIETSCRSCTSTGADPAKTLRPRL